MEEAWSPARGPGRCPLDSGHFPATTWSHGLVCHTPNSATESWPNRGSQESCMQVQQVICSFIEMHVIYWNSTQLPGGQLICTVWCHVTAWQNSSNINNTINMVCIKFLQNTKTIDACTRSIKTDLYINTRNDFWSYVNVEGQIVQYCGLLGIDKSSRYEIT